MALEPILDAGVRWKCGGGKDKRCMNNGVVFLWVWSHIMDKRPTLMSLCETHLRETAAPLLEPADV